MQHADESPGLQLPLKYDVVRGYVRINTLEGFCSVRSAAIGNVAVQSPILESHLDKMIADFANL